MIWALVIAGLWAVAVCGIALAGMVVTLKIRERGDLILTLALAPGLLAAAAFSILYLLPHVVALLGGGI